MNDLATTKHLATTKQLATTKHLATAAFTLTLFWLGLGPLGIPATTYGDSPVDATSRDPLVINSVAVRYASEVRVPASATGRIQAVRVRPNQAVRVGEAILRLDGTQMAIQRRAANLRLTKARRDAADTQRIDFAQLALDEAENEYQDAQAVQRDARGAIASTRIRGLRLSIQRAKLGVAEAEKARLQSQTDVELRQAELELLDQQIEDLRVDAPIGGVAIEVNHAAGEWVTAGEVVVTLAEISRLRVDALIDANACPPDLSGQTFRVRWSDPVDGKTHSLSGTIESIDPQLVGGKQYRLHGIIENRKRTPTAPTAETQGTPDWLLRPGTPVQLLIDRGRQETHRIGRRLENVRP
ncbi:MAG: HlyD family efflux transporter periplasmic adaptor subunit [Planctomycetota bacterium]